MFLDDCVRKVVLLSTLEQLRLQAEQSVTCPSPEDKKRKPKGPNSILRRAYREAKKVRIYRKNKLDINYTVYIIFYAKANMLKILYGNFGYYYYYFFLPSFRVDWYR